MKSEKEVTHALTSCSVTDNSGCNSQLYQFVDRFPARIHSKLLQILHIHGFWLQLCPPMQITDRQWDGHTHTHSHTSNQLTPVLLGYLVNQVTTCRTSLHKSHMGVHTPLDRGIIRKRERVYLSIGIRNCEQPHAAHVCNHVSSATRLGLIRVCLVEYI